MEQARGQMLVPLESVSPASRSDFEARLLARAQAADVIDLVRQALDPVLVGLQEVITHTGDVPPLQMPDPPFGPSAPAAMVRPGPSHVGSSPQPQLPPPLILQTSRESSAGLGTAVEDLGLSPV